MNPDHNCPNQLSLFFCCALFVLDPFLHWYPTTPDLIARRVVMYCNCKLTSSPGSVLPLCLQKIHVSPNFCLSVCELFRVGHGTRWLFAMMRTLNVTWDTTHNTTQVDMHSYSGQYFWCDCKPVLQYLFILTCTTTWTTLNLGFLYEFSSWDKTC